MENTEKNIQQEHNDNVWISITIKEYSELLAYKGRYEELKDICNNKLTSPILRPDAMPVHNHPWPVGVRGVDHNTGHSCGYEAPRHAHNMEEENEKHIPGV